MRHLLLTALLLFCLAPLAQAACTNPDGEEAVIIYNTTSKNLQFCNGAAWITMGGGVGLVGPGSTMFDGWPDAIVCDVTNPAWGPVTVYPHHMPLTTNGKFVYRTNQEYRSTLGKSDGLVFNADRTFASLDGSGDWITTSCNGKSIADLYLAGQAFNFNGGGAGGGGGASESMADDWPDAITCNNGTNKWIVYIAERPNVSGKYIYNFPDETNPGQLEFNADGTFSGQVNSGGADCLNKPISQLYTEGKAFDFVGVGPVADTLSSLSCTNGQVAQWDGTAWSCGTVSGGGGGGGGGDPIPSGAVMAFDLAACPSGWTEYTAARGRFIRGIDNGAGNDPSGTRAPGNVQDDAFQGHKHSWSSGGAQDYGLGDSLGFSSAYNPGSNTGAWVGPAISDGTNGPPRTSSETRPKNVALLYCRKS